MKLKKIINLFTIAIVGAMPIIATSCSNSNNNNIQSKPEQDNNNNNINLNTITSINKKSFRDIWFKHPSLFQNDTLNLSFLPNLETIENDTFMLDENSANSNSKISKIIFNKKLKTIGNNAFKNIQSLNSLNFPSSIEHIGNHSFDNAFVNDFSKIIFNNEHTSLQTIGNNSFLNNNNLNLFILNNEPLKTKFENNKESIGYKNTILTDDLDSSGRIGNLEISKFLPIISLLELTNQTRLSSLTNEILNNKIKLNIAIQSNPIYKNTTFEIQDGSSEKLGVLKLKINISNINFLNNENVVTISGFDKISAKKLSLSSIKINSYNYFENLQEVQNIHSWTDNEWKKYLSEINVKTINGDEYFNLALEKHSNDIDLNFKYNYINDKHTLYLISKIKNNIYTSGKWIQDGEIIQTEIKGANLKPINFELPNNKNDLYDFLNKKIEINEQERNDLITNLYASKYLSNFRLRIKTWTNTLLKINDKYIEYSKKLGIGKINIEARDAYANDIDGILSFNYHIKDEENISNSYLYINSYQIDGFKKINNLFNNKPTISINNNGQNIKNRFIQKINEIKTKNELNNLSSNKGTIEIPNLGVNGYGILATTENNTKAIILNDISKGEEINSKLFDTQSNKFEFTNSIFINKQFISKNINFSTNLFNNEFIINSLFFRTNMSEKAKLIGINNNTFKYESNIEIIVSLCKNSIDNDNNQEFKFNGKLSLTLLLNDFK